MGWIQFFSSLVKSRSHSRVPYERLREMLSLGGRMFREVTAPLVDVQQNQPTREEILEMDREINRLENEARRAILTAAAVAPEAYATTGLLTANLIRDAERIGDFAKNIFDVFENAGALDEHDHVDFLRSQREFVLRLFDETWEVFETGNRERAEQLISDARPINREGARIVRELLTATESQHPVAVALLLRFFRRIQSHLVHILETVVMPARLDSDE